jgi:hypothetical protein
MPLEPDNQHHVTAAQGYLELGMPLEADAELDSVNPDVRHLPEVLAVRIVIYSALKKWELMQTVAKRMALYDPEEPQWTVSWAYATRRADSIEAARMILINAVERLPNTAIFHYNLACYECQLGDLEAAKARLKRASELEQGFRRIALDDEDLRPLWDSI